MGRLFAFGCSFTQYAWPTWADILGREYEYFENWGQPGAGNLFISSAVAEASVLRNFTKDDTVMIMWSNMMREDRYIDKIHKWFTPGNITTQFWYPKDFVKRFVTIRGCYIRDMAQIYLTSKLLDSIGCKYEFMSMVDLVNPNQYIQTDASDEVSDILEFYKDVVNKFKPSVHKVIFNNDWNSRLIIEIDSELRKDCHPVPKEHLEYLEKVFPEIKISQSTKDWVDSVNITARTLAHHDKINKGGPFIGWNKLDNKASTRL